MPIVSIIDQFGIVLRTFDVKENDIIFNSLEDQGFTLPHGCLAGSCSACRIEIIGEKESVSDIGAVEKDTVASFLKKRPEHANKLVRLSCRTKVKANISIRPLD